MSEQNQTTAPKIYESKVLLNWETPERKGNIVFPKPNCACRRCPFSDWQINEVDIEAEENQEHEKEPATMLELTNYCHDRYRETFGRGLPNIPDCDGLYKQPKE